jgi:hypothetical protein
MYLYFMIINHYSLDLCVIIIYNNKKGGEIMDVKSVIEYLKVLLSDEFEASVKICGDTILLHFPTERKDVFLYLDF